MNAYKPAAAPGCWGMKYQDGEKECEQCRYNDSCRPAMMERVMNPPARTSLPVVRNYAPMSPPPPPTTTTMVPLPAKPYFAPPVTSIPLPKPPAPSVPMPQPVQAATSQYYQPATGFSLPNPKQPNPLQAMHRPGAPAPAYYFTQYPGESVASRVGKNIVLRALEAVFGELMQFFRHWTWPPA